MTARLPMQGDWYDAKLVEDTVEQLANGRRFGCAFADVQPHSAAIRTR